MARERISHGPNHMSGDFPFLRTCAHLVHPTDRKRLLFAEAERLAGQVDYWRTRNKYFHQEDVNYQRFLVPPGLRILELGCGSGSLLAALQPSMGVGVDFSP